MDKNLIIWRVHASMADVVHALRTGIAKRGWFEYAVVDHGSDMKTVGASPHEAFTIVFGNPALGSRILAKAWTMVVDIPLRLGVYRQNDETAVIYRDLRSLIASHAPSSDVESLAVTANRAVEGLVIEALTPFHASH